MQPRLAVVYQKHGYGGKVLCINSGTRLDLYYRRAITERSLNLVLRVSRLTLPPGVEMARYDVHDQALTGNRCASPCGFLTTGALIDIAIVLSASAGWLASSCMGSRANIPVLLGGAYL